MKQSKHNTEILPATTNLQARNKPSKRKPWARALTQTGFDSHKRKNASLEVAYHQIITFVKRMRLLDGERYFERDYKQNPLTSLGMHSFLTTSFYIYLECQLDFVYRVEYAFCNCVYEAELRRLLTHYPMDLRSKEVRLLPDLPTYYQRTLAYQPPEFVHSFKR